MQQYPLPRLSGVLMPVFSLPGPRGIGTLGGPAEDFIRFLRRAGQGLWQLLPLGPTGYGASPYQSVSAFAGNPLLIDLDLVAEKGLLTKQELDAAPWPRQTETVEYEAVEAAVMPLLRKAFARWQRERPVPGFETSRSDAFWAFCLREAAWLDDYALFMALRRTHGDVPWQEWPREVRLREAWALEAARQEHAAECEFWRFVQFLFDEQWQRVRRLARAEGILLMGDVPIYVSPDSADAWCGGELFETDANGGFLRVAGCPPDYFSPDGQHWGNPLYNWEAHRREGYRWWIARMRSALSTYDLVRLDHFRGFDTYWAIPAGAPNARTGRWEQGPGLAFFEALEAALGPLPLVAEDLGLLFDSVRELLAAARLPGMNVLQFAFSGEDSGYLPHNHLAHSVTYPGTHDSTTVRDWLENASTPAERAAAAAYIPQAKGETAVFSWLRCVQASASRLAIVPMADWLELGPEGRINTPGTLGGNWLWRMRPGALTPALAESMKALAFTYFRLPR